MGNQLWTSRTTGYRRKGTRLAELMSVLGGGVVTRTIFEPLQSAPADSSAPQVKGILDALGFDVAGVQQVEDGPVLGFVVKEELLSGVIGDHLKHMSPPDLISDSTPLAELFSVLRRKERVFVLTGSSVRGIVTRTDLNKPPIRVYLFGLISLLEMHLQFWVDRSYDGGSWERELKEKRLASARELLSERRRSDEAVTLLDCLQFADKAQLLLAKPETVAKLNLSSKSKAKSLLGKAQKLRDDLAHSQLDLSRGTSWEKRIELVQSIEMLVHHSDAVIEQEAETLRVAQEHLWGTPGA